MPSKRSVSVRDALLPLTTRGLPRTAVLTAVALLCTGSLSITADKAVAVPCPALTVCVLDDAGAGSLRQAILDANAASGPDTITFQSGVTGTITLTTG